MIEELINNMRRILCSGDGGFVESHVVNGFTDVQYSREY